MEFVKFNFDGKLCVTGGMNNVLRVWSVEPNTEATGPEDAPFSFKLKTKLESGPAESDDILVVEWHPKGNAVLCGGKDFTLYLLNGATGDFLACFSGHEDEVLCAKFTPNGGKQIVSSSADQTIRVWSPIKQDCLTVIRNKNAFHKAAINTFELHESRQLCISGDLEGGVFYSNYVTGQVGGLLATHAESVESIAISRHDENPFAVSCGIDVNLHIYSLKDMCLRQKVKAADHGGFSMVQFSKLDQNMCYASSTLGNIVIIDVRGGAIVRIYRGHAAPINDFFEDTANKRLVTAGDDFVCNIYDLLK